MSLITKILQLLKTEESESTTPVSLQNEEYAQGYVLKEGDIIVIPEDCELIFECEVPNIGIYGNIGCKESNRYKVVKK